jgi:para-aminobenzoate synthetase
MFRWDDEGIECGSGNSLDTPGDKAEIWHIGAGGAVTALSTPIAEREEMTAKLAGTLGIFGKININK